MNKKTFHGCHIVVNISGSLHQVLDYWTAASKMCAPDPRMDRKTELAAEITHNSGVSFVLHEQNIADPIRKIWGNLKGKKVASSCVTACEFCWPQYPIKNPELGASQFVYSKFARMFL